jgi:hypothetical protein
MPCCASGCVKASIENSSLGSWPGSSAQAAQQPPAELVWQQHQKQEAQGPSAELVWNIAKAGQEPSAELVEEPRRALRRMAPVMPQRP